VCIPGTADSGQIGGTKDTEATNEDDLLGSDKSVETHYGRFQQPRRLPIGESDVERSGARDGRDGKCRSLRTSAASLVDGVFLRIIAEKLGVGTGSPVIGVGVLGRENDDACGAGLGQLGGDLDRDGESGTAAQLGGEFNRFHSLKGKVSRAAGQYVRFRRARRG